MDPIQQRLEAVYHKKAESDIDRKLKSASTTVLDQRIAFHDATKTPSSSNAHFKGKYLFMKSPPSTPTVTPTKKDTESQNNNAVDLEKEGISELAQSPSEKKGRIESPEREIKISQMKSSDARSRSPLKSGSRLDVTIPEDLKSAKKKIKKKKKKKKKKKHKRIYLTPSFIEESGESDSEMESATNPDADAPTEGPSKPRSESPKPGTSAASETNSSDDDDDASTDKPHRYISSGSHRIRGRSPSLGRDRIPVRIPLPHSPPRRRSPTRSSHSINKDSSQKCIKPPSWKDVRPRMRKADEETSSTERTGKAKEKTRHLTTTVEDFEYDSEPEVIIKHGTSTRPAAPAPAPDVSKENASEKSDDEETFSWLDFKEYLPDDYTNTPFFPSNEAVRQMVMAVPTGFNTGEEGDGLPHPETVLCPENRLDYAWKYPEGGSGLVNRGNTCFINAALQCLTYTPPLVNYLLSGQHSRECRMMQKERCILCGFTRYLHESLKINKNNIVPIWFLNNLYSVAKHFSLGRQEDSHEYLRLTLEQMQKVCLVGHTSLDRYSKETTMVNQIFGGFLRSQVVCLKCKAKSNTYDPFLDISLDIKACNTLEKAFEIFVSPERLDIENAYRCSNCKQKVEALKRFTIHKAPNIMTIQLKRFHGTSDDKFGVTSFRGVKITKAVKFPPRLNIRGFMSIKTGPPEVYGLYALLFHEGHSANSGHYTCTVKSGSRWFHISDGLKIRTSLHTVNLQDVYVLFYMREDKQQNGIIQNPSIKTEEQKAKEAKERERQRLLFSQQPSTSGLQKPSTSGLQKPSTSGLQKPSIPDWQRPSTSGLQKPSTSGTQNFNGPTKPKIIHTNESQFKPVKTITNSGTTPSNDIGTPVTKKETIKVPLAVDRNKVSFGIKTPSKAQPGSFSSDTRQSQMATSASAPALNSAKPRLVMQIKHGKVTTIETSPDGQRRIVSDDEEVVAKASESKSHKRFKKSQLVPYADESSSESESAVRIEDRPKVKKKESEDTEADVLFDTKLNATTSVPGNIHLMKSISSHLANSKPTKPTDATESKSIDSVQDEKPAKSANLNFSNNSQENYNGGHVHMKHRNGDIHIYDSPASHVEERHHTAGKKRKLIEDARGDIVNGQFHVVSEKIPLLDPVENGHRDKTSDEYRLLKKAKKHKKHKKDKHRHKEHRYEELLNESEQHSEHHVKKHKKKKRKHKERDYDIEEEHSYKKRRVEEPNEARGHKRFHHFDTEERVHKRPRHESESSSSAEFEWVERKVDNPIKVSKSSSW